MSFVVKSIGWKNVTEPTHYPDEYWMAQAIRLAEQGRFTTTPNPNVGCVIVNNGQQVGQGWHQKAGTAHAEVHALAEAGARAAGATAYVTLEPCSHYGRTPPCAEALVKAGVARVVCAMTDPNPLVAGQGLVRLQAAGIEASSGLLAEQAEALNLGFLQRMRSGRPRVTVKLAASLDGATALANGESQWITGPAARQDVQWGRAAACAVVTGVGTVLADDPSLNVRLDWADRQPVRLVLDSQLRTPPAARIVQLPGRCVLLHSAAADPQRRQQLVAAGADCVPLASDPQGRVALPAVLDWCAQQQFNQLWVEAGASLAGSFAEQGLVDEFIYYQAAKFLGADTLPVLAMQVPSLQQATSLSVADVRFVGKDLRWRLLRA